VLLMELVASVIFGRAWGGVVKDIFFSYEIYEATAKRIEQSYNMNNVKLLLFAISESSA